MQELVLQLGCKIDPSDLAYQLLTAVASSHFSLNSRQLSENFTKPKKWGTISTKEMLQIPSGGGLKRLNTQLEVYLEHDSIGAR
ncbi:MAG: hypothetical protein AAGF98_11560 [Cyanobacteria bacterium P01_H01_bin.153]